MTLKSDMQATFDYFGLSTIEKYWCHEAVARSPLSARQCYRAIAHSLRPITPLENKLFPRSERKAQRGK